LVIEIPARIESRPVIWGAMRLGLGVLLLLAQRGAQKNRSLQVVKH
jgi:hypothetical protein